MEAQEHADVDAQDGMAEAMLERQEVAQAVGHAQHPLADRHPRQHRIDQVGGLRRHPPPAAARAEAPTLAGEGHEPFEGTGPTAHASEATREHPAAEELAELALDEMWKDMPVAGRSDRREQRLEVLPHNRVEDALVASPGNVGDACHRKYTSERGAGSSRRQSVPRNVCHALRFRSLSPRSRFRQRGALWRRRFPLSVGVAAP
jgi:hypothetical protein